MIILVLLIIVLLIISFISIREFFRNEFDENLNEYVNGCCEDAKELLANAKEHIVDIKDNMKPQKKKHSRRFISKRGH